MKMTDLLLECHILKIGCMTDCFSQAEELHQPQQK